MTDAPVSLTGTSVSIIGAGQSVLDDGLTLVRTRGQFEAFLVASTAAGDGFSGAIGIGIVSAPAFAIGVTAVPMPIGEIEWDGWLYHRFFAVHAPGTGTASSSEVRQRVEIDSKAMRKVGREEVIYAAVEVFITGTASLKVRLFSRVLLKLP